MKSGQLALDGGSPVHPGALMPVSKVCCDELEKKAVERVIKSGTFCSVFEQAAEVPSFEREFAEFVGARHAVAFTSGTTAQHASLVALGIGPGDQVVVPTFTFISTAYTALISGAIPVFADVCAGTLTIDPKDIVRKISPRTKAIVPVHWLGNAADMDEITAIAQKHNLAVIEDCAHGPGIFYRGKQVGSYGKVACWSLQQNKMLTAAGEGGVATTDDNGTADRLRQIRDHGKKKAGKRPDDLIAPYRVTRLGNNYRLSEIHAAFARTQLSKLHSFIDRRRKAYVDLSRKMAKIDGVKLMKPNSVM